MERNSRYLNMFLASFLKALNEPNQYKALDILFAILAIEHSDNNNLSNRLSIENKADFSLRLNSLISTDFHEEIDLFSDTLSNIDGYKEENLNQAIAIYNASRYELSRVGEKDVLFEQILNIVEETNSQFPVFLTPQEIAKLTILLFNNMKSKRIYDPYCRTGEFISKAAKLSKGRTFISGNHPLEFMRKLTRYRLFLCDVKDPSVTSFGIDESLNKQDQYDLILTNPPFGAKTNVGNHKSKEDSWSCKYKHSKSELAYITTILDQLVENGEAAIILPLGVLDSQSSLNLRKGLIQENVLESIILLPDGLFQWTKISVAIMVLKKRRNKKEVLLIDASEQGVRDGNQTKLDDESISRIVELFKNFGEDDSANSSLISKNKFEEFDYSLNPQRYQTIEDFILIDLKLENELKRECIEIEKEISTVQWELKKLF